MLDKERVARLYARQAHGIKPGLETTLELLKRLGHPERSLAAVHVAGTNGKGSVCAMLAAALGTGGIPVGLYTSPHLVHFNERFVVNGEAIPDKDLDALLAEIETVAEAVENDNGMVATFFECTTAAAFLHFQRRGVRLAVVETGMGGRLDATNVLVPLLSVITRIGLDHMEYLGPSLSAIAAEKAGIIKPGRPVVAGAMPQEAQTVLAGTARERGSPWVDAVAAVSVRRISGDLKRQKVQVSSEERDYGTLPTALAASYQVENIATVVAAIEALATHAGILLPDSAVAQGLASAKWPGRFQLIGEHPSVVVDGAHNPDGAAALVKALKDAHAAKCVGLLCGFCADKDVDGFFRTVAPIAKRVWTVPVPNPRSMHPAETSRRAQRYQIPSEPVDDYAQALKAARDWARTNEGTVVVCGSLFLAGQALSQP